LGNFAKNVRSFQVFDDSGKPRSFEKTAKDVWQVDTDGATHIEVRYSYYAAELNAGSTYLDDQLLYVNPVNCCAYIKGRENESCELTIHVPEGRTYAGGLKWDGEKLTAHSYHQLADSPFLFAKKIQHNSYEVNNVVFHLWFHGPAQVDWDRLIHDFKAFTQVQLDDFGEFIYPDAYINVMRQKLGLHEAQEEDVELIKELIGALQDAYVDYTLFFRTLSRYDGNREALYDIAMEPVVIHNWLELYDLRLAQESQTQEKRQEAMLRVNPKYVLKNYMLDKAINLAQIGDVSMVEKLLYIGAHPYDELEECEEFAGETPEIYKNIGLACSS
jgi:hypothetical protein